MKKFILGILLTPSLLLAQHHIVVNVQKVPSSSGKVSVAVYNDHNGFLKFEHVYTSASVAAAEGTTEVIVKNVPEGEYAIAVFYDENGNDLLDTNWLGIPKEKVAFSNAKMKTFGPPNFKECAFKHKGSTSLAIDL
ncbi:MAG: DUF2141 domain-containing protein [Croceitalea sp.]|nr:DUF2141 domain-containing protein [Croceitalea sp.]MBT8239116.1 DUF2141 domain-containing protein [Croceitalea sp.]NNC34356.1 DUF2141 domain-containing protein [Croceitalea sp.]NNL08731.1 DUF2141 domain-containing protein [Croceitalea sp.]NNM18328.1 DUF2141 domain-containing protein [Croceitalea sp.]